MNGENRRLNCGHRCIFIARISPELLVWLRRILSQDGLKSLFLSDSSVCGGAGLWTGPAGDGLGLGKGLFAGQAERGKERNLRVRAGFKGRCLDAVPLRLLPLDRKSTR